VNVSDFEAMFDLWRAGDETGSAAYFTHDGVFHETGKEPIAGRENIANHWAPFFHGGPEWRMTVHDIFGDGQQFAVSYTWEIKLKDGTWTGSLGCALVKTQDGKIKEWREFKG